MPFDQTSIQDVVCSPRNADLAVSWSSTEPPGTWFQLYVDRKFTWHGTARKTCIPHPVGFRPVRIEVGAVLASEASLNLASSLPAVPGGGNRITVTWLGGTFLGVSIVGFHVYMGTAPGGAVDYSHSVKTIAAYPQGLVSDGWGMGGFSQGGFGFSSATYSWTSDPVASGAWQLAVKPFDSAGNEGSAITWTVTVAGPPKPVARNANGERLTYTVNRSTSGGFSTGGWNLGGFSAGTGFSDGGWNLGGFGVGLGGGLPFVTLDWLASPGT